MTAALLLHRADGASPTTSFRQAAFGPADPFARHREIAWEGPGAMSAGRVGLVGEVDVARYPHTETIVVVEGTLSLIAAEAPPLVLRRGEGAVIAGGTALRIQATTRCAHPGLSLPLARSQRFTRRKAPRTPSEVRSRACSMRRSSRGSCLILRPRRCIS